MSNPSDKTSMPLAIIGMACRLPGADNLDQYWDLVSQGRSAIAELPPDRLDQDLYYDPQVGVRNKTYCKLAAIISSRQFNHQACPIAQELANSVDNSHLLMCEVAAAALRHARLDPFDLPLRNTGVFVGHAQGSSLSGDYTYATYIEEAAQFLRESEDFRGLPAQQQEAVIAELVEHVRGKLPRRSAASPDAAANMVAGTISKAFELSGPYLAINSACASSLQAMLLGARALQMGHIEMAIVGGASDCKSDTLVLFSNARAMSPTGSRPFAEDADGLICSEGYVSVVLKTLPRALADGDPIQAVVRGLGISSDGKGKSLWAPRKEGQIKAMQRAHREGLDMAKLQYVEAHATATQLGDATELTTLAEVLSDKLPKGKKIPIGSVKANIGHSLETAGMAGLIKTVLCMQHKTIPPAINVQHLNPKIPWDQVPVYVPRAREPWPAQADGSPRRAVVNAFGIGGLNMQVVLDEYDAEAARQYPLPSPSSGPNSTSAGRDEDAVAVIGVGCVLPGAGNIDKYWDLLCSGRDPKQPVPPGRWRTDLGYEPGAAKPYRSPATLGGFITDFEYDWRKHKVPPKQIANADPLQFMLLDAVDQAMHDAGYDTKPFDSRELGIVVGTEFGGDFSTHLQMGLRLPELDQIITGLLERRGVSRQQIKNITKHYEDTLLKHWPALIDETGSFSTSTLASRIVKTWNSMGGAAAIDSGATSALTALSACVDALLCGDSDLMICAAGQRRMGLPTYEAMSMAGTLATDEHPRAPLDARVQGIVPGEGVGAFLLKRLTDARRDGDRIHAIIRGVSAASAATCGDALRLAMERSLQRAGVDPADVAMLETDGTGTARDDEDQARSMVSVYGRTGRRQPLLVSSVVAQLGHLTGAMGAASLIKASLAIERGQMPPTVGLETPLAAIAENPQVLRASSQSAPITHATQDGRRLGAVSSCAKGLAYHMVIERGTKVPASEIADLPEPASKPLAAPRPAHAAQWSICRIGAASPAELAAKLAGAKDNCATLFAAADTARFTAADRVRLAVVADNEQSLAEKLAKAAGQINNPAAHPVLEQQGIFYRQLGQPPPRIAFLFPGQGSQYAGMLRELVQQVPAAAEAMRQIDAATARHGYPTFAQLAWEQDTKLGQDVWLTQLSMLLADKIMLAALADRGIHPDLVSGHSYGELAALTAAGVWDLEQAIPIARARCDEISGCATARGTMLATKATPQAIEQIAVQLPERVYVANKNAPDQTVVGGRREALEKLADLLRENSYSSQMLPVPCPFHTPLMQGSAGPLERALEAAALRAPQIPMLSSVTNRLVSGPDEVRANLVAQMTTPVEYVGLIEQIAGEQETVLVEVGPQQALTRLHRRILQGKSFSAVASDNPQRPGVEQLYYVQALLECTGAMDGARRTVGHVPRAEQTTPATHAPRPEIIHFDATARRRERLRGAAMSNSAAKSPPAPVRQAAERLAVDGAPMYSEPASQPPPAPPVEIVLAAEPSQPAMAAAEAGPSAAELETFLINFVVEQTGYPPDVVELDADLEADLGIDSIKKAQLFGELQEYFDIMPSDDLTLDDFPTLRHVLNFLATAEVKGDLTTDDPPPTIAQQPAAVEATPAPVPQPAAAAQSSTSAAELETFLINFVVEQTGYPPDVVELDADLEADLGIDSIKKAQLFGELQEYFDIMPSDDLTLDDFPTLRHVLNFLAAAEVKGDLTTDQPPPEISQQPAAVEDTPTPVSQPAAPVAQTSTSTAELETFLINFVVEQTGYPPDVIELDADLEADLGIDSIKKAQLFGELQEYFDIVPSDDLTLDDFPTLRHVLNFLAAAETKGNLTTDDPSPAVAEPPAATPTEPSPAAPNARGQAPRLAPASPPVVAIEPVDQPAVGQVEVIRLSGAPYEMGLQHGREKKTEIRQILRRLADLAGPALEDLPIPDLTQHDPSTFFQADELDELWGIADAVEVPLGNIIAHNLAAFADMGGGSMHFAVTAARNPHGTLLHGSHEELPLLAGLRECLVPLVQARRPAGSIAHLSCSFVGTIGGLSGINAHGVAITSSMLADGPRGQLHWLITRAVLEQARSVGQALDVLRGRKPDGAWNACISHGQSDQLCYVEHDGQSLAVQDQDDVLMAANHRLLHPPAAEVPADSRVRLQSLDKLLFLNLPAGVTAGELLDVFRGQHTASVLGQNGSAARRSAQQDDNAVSVVIDPGQGDMWIHSGGLAVGGANGFHRLRVAELLAPADTATTELPPETGGHVPHDNNTRKASARGAYPTWLDLEEDSGQEEAFSHRFVMRTIDIPLKPDAPRVPQWHGSALVIGNNPTAEALRGRLQTAGVTVHNLTIGDDLEETLSRFDQLWQQGPMPHLFLMSARDEDLGNLTDPAVWRWRRHQQVIVPYFLCQRWIQLAGQAKLLSQCTLIAATALGGDFGITSDVSVPECGALTGLAKSLHIEYTVLGNRQGSIFKAIDAPSNESPDLLADNILHELAAGTGDYEVAYIEGKRCLQYPVCQAVEVQTPAIRPGAPWVVTGGARGITAECALELGRRFGVKLHLIGTTPLTQIDPAWHNLSEQQLEQLKSSTMLQARQAGERPKQAWDRVQKAIEIARSLRAFQQAEIQAAYYVCDVSDREALAKVLDDIRGSSGPIEGILHGAGIERACRFDRKQRQDVLATFGAKVDGAYHLMTLTREDPIRHFIGFGSVSGRMGGNGQTDYSASSDMLCKLIGWYRTQRPTCHAVGFHWYPWDEIGMAARPDMRVTFKMTGGPSFMPKREGVRHLVRELCGNAAESEVLITDWKYFLQYYPDPKDIDLSLLHDSVREQPASESADGRIAQRCVLRMAAAPLPGDTPAEPKLAGPAIILGENASSRALRERLERQGTAVQMLPTDDNAEVVIAQLERFWASQPARHMFLMTARDEDPADLLDRAGWRRRRARGVIVPFLVTQRWTELLASQADSARATLVAATSLGGDFGIACQVSAPEGGALAGLLKSLYMEDTRKEHSELRVKVVDAPAGEPPEDLAEAICRELAADRPEVEVGLVGGRRSVVRSMVQPVESLERKDLARGGTWVVTGGARGITAATALELGRRYGLKLHLIGRSPAPEENATWRNCSDAELKKIKSTLVREAISSGRSPEKDWERVKKDIKIYDTLAKYARAGVQVTYHSCDVSDWDALDAVLQKVRAADGPIEAVIHGAGYGKSGRFQQKPRKELEQTIEAKLDGAVALLSLTREDPVRYFIGFGSISGRFGGNGLSDYAAANEMMSKLLDWVRPRRSGCALTNFHWQSWDEVGMAMLGDNLVGSRGMLNMEFISPREGIEHLHQELRAGLPEAEILITDGHFERLFYPHAAAAAESPSEAKPAADDVSAERPLIEALHRQQDGSMTAQVRLDPVADPFLKEHRLRGKPFLPGVIGLETLAEAAACWDSKRQVAAIKDVEIINGLAFHNDQPVLAKVTIGETGTGVSCLFTSEQRDRKGRLIKEDRPHVKGMVELSEGSIQITDPPPGEPPNGWHPFTYAEDGLIYHGPPLRCLKECCYQYDGGWARMLAPPVGELTGSRQGTGLIVPAAMLDACLVACGSFIYLQFGKRMELPHGFDSIRVVRQPRNADVCVLRFYYRGREDRHSRFDFTLFAADNAPIMQVLGYRTVLVAEGSL